MNKRWLAVLILLVMLVALWLSRTLWVRWAVNVYLAPYELVVGCLEWNMDRRLNIQIQHLCVQHSDARLEAYEVNWHRAENSLDIEQAILTLTPASEAIPPDASLAAPVDLSLPVYLPELNVQNLRVESEYLRQPLRLSIKQTAPNQLLLGSDWHMLLTLGDKKLTAQLNWKLQDIAELTASFPTEQLSPPTLQTPIVTEFSFDGQVLHSQSALTLQQDIQLDNCTLSATGSGLVDISADWLNRTAELDLSHFELKGAWQQCALLQDIPESWRFSTATVHFPEALKISSRSIKVAHLSVDTAEQSAASQSVNLALQFNELEWLFGGDLQSRYQLQAKMLEGGHIQSTGELQFNSQGLGITSQDSHLQLARWQQSGWILAQLDADVTFGLQPDGQFTVGGDVQVASLQQPDSMLEDIHANISINDGNISRFRLDLESHIASLSHQALTIRDLNSQLHIDVTGLTGLLAEGKSQIAEIHYDKRPVGAVQIQHDLQADWDKQHITSQHQAVMQNGWQVELDSMNRQLRLSVTEQPLSSLNDIANQWLPEIDIQSGQFSTELAADLAAMQASGAVKIDNLSLDYQDNQIHQARYHVNLEVDSAGLQLTPARLHVGQIDSGVVIQDVNALIQGKDNRISASDIEGQIFDGQFNIERLWLDGRDQSTLLKLSHIDTAKILDLQKQSGIEVTGLVKGSLPIRINQDGFSIVNGEITNQGAGQLLISDSQAFNALKAQQPKLEKQLALLENLQINRLNSSVNLAPDGVLTMDIAIKGYNPLQQEQVNFNYGHEENILVLLQALKLTDTLTEKIEKSIK